MKKGFTIIEVSILFVIFLIVALLVIPLSLDDSIQAQNTSKWHSVQSDFANIFYTINTQRDKEDFNFQDAFNATIASDIKDPAQTYKITFLNGTYPSSTYRFEDFYTTNSHAIISVKWNNNQDSEIKGYLMYDVNGNKSPNVWGRDVFGYNIYIDRFEPFGKNEPASVQNQDCSKNGTGLSCSNWYLIGGSFK